MRKFYARTCALLFLFFLSFHLVAQNNFFSQAKPADLATTKGQREIIPEKFHASSLDISAMKNFLWSLPSEKDVLNRRGETPVLELPMPDGSSARFHVWESSIMEPGLESKLPEMKTFAGQGIDDPYATVRIDYNPYFGFHAQILSAVKGRVFIDPYAKWDINNYQSYFTKDYYRATKTVCATPVDVLSEAERGDLPKTDAACRGSELFTYRLALACTGEYARAVCLPNAPTVNATAAAMLTTVNRVDGVYEQEVSIRMVLVANNNDLIYLNGTTDPYTNDDGQTMLGQNQTNVNAVIGMPNYDIGHVVSTGGGGIASLRVPCTGSKARGVTGLPNPVGDAFDIDFVAHEMGHQWGANHTFNSIICGANRNGSTAYEPGSGTSIMAYAGICGTDDTQPHSDPYFHAISFDEISNYIMTGNGSVCKVATPTGNLLPVITSMDNNNVSIPVNTPFTLSGSAMDPDGDPITYSWEQWDLGPVGPWNSGSNNSAPNFKSRIPKIDGSRTFPDMSVIIAGFPTNPPPVMGGLKGETLPKVAKTLKFRLTVRDNRMGGGGVISGGNGGCQTGFDGPFQVNVVATSGPFAVTSPNGGESYSGGSTQTVTWDMVGTNTAPINCTDVKISLSTDGGLTYPIVLLNSTPNDGSEPVTFPSTTSTQARIKVEAIGNIFFDISNANFILSTPITGFDFDTPSPANVSCAGPATASVSLGTTSFGGFQTAINLTADNVPVGTSITFNNNIIAPGDNVDVTLNNANILSNGTYTVTITGTAGTTIRTRDISFVIEDGTGPTITQVPQPQATCAGTDALFNVVATGVLSYQWQVNTGTGFANIDGANTASYTVDNITTTQDGYQYRVLLTGQCGITVSDPATLTVQTAPSITDQPTASTICLGSNTSFSVAASGTNLTYQWQLSTDGGANFNLINTASENSYSLNNVTTAMNNSQYRVMISGTCAPSVASDAAILTVISPVEITNHPDEVVICETGNVSFLVAANSSIPVNYEWQVSTNNGNNYTGITNGSVYSGVATATLNLTGVTPDLNNNLYRVAVSNDVCTIPVFSENAMLTVNARPTVTVTANPGITILPGQSTTISASIQPAATGFDITWYKNDNIVPGINGTTYLVDSVEIGDYKVGIVNETTGCHNESQVLTIGTAASERLFIFPNPNNGQFTLSFYNPSGATTRQTVAVYNSSGAEVYNSALPISGLYTLLNINLKGAARGVYIVVVGDALGKRLTKGKIVIQ